MFQVPCMSWISWPSCHAYLDTGILPVWRAGSNHLNQHLWFQWMDWECASLGSGLELILLLLLTWWAIWERSAYTKAVACIRRKSSAFCRLEICQIGPYHTTTGFSWQLLILPTNIFVTVQNALKLKIVCHQGKMV